MTWQAWLGGGGAKAGPRRGLPMAGGRFGAAAQGLNRHVSHFPVRSADFQSAFTVIASVKPTSSRRSRMPAFCAVHEVSCLKGAPGLFRPGALASWRLCLETAFLSVTSGKSVVQSLRLRLGLWGILRVPGAAFLKSLPNQWTFLRLRQGPFARLLRIFAANRHKFLFINILQLISAVAGQGQSNPVKVNQDINGCFA
jgi:hypothetical protein